MMIPALVPSANETFAPPLPLDREIVELVDGRMGLVFAPDRDAYVEGARKAGADPARLAAMGETCRRYVLENCGPGNPERIYQVLLAKP